MEILRKKKVSARKKVASKSAVATKKKVAPKKKVAAKKKTATKKAPATKRPTKAEIKKATAAAKKEAEAKAAASKPVVKKKPKRRGRVTKMTVSEVMISLTTLADQWEDLAWMEALYLYGNHLDSADGHRELRFMVIFKGLRRAPQQKAAQKALDKILKPAVPVRRRLDFLDDLAIIQYIELENPAFVASFGQAIPIFVRVPS